MSKYILNYDETAITDIDAGEFIGDTTIVFPSSVNGHKITGINISDNTIKTLNKMFKHFDVLIENGIQNMEDNMFAYCNSIHSISIPPSMKAIPEGCFIGSSLQEVIFQEGSTLRTIGASAFADCFKLESISLPQTVSKIRYHAFRNSGLKEITFLKNKTGINIEDSVFAECTYLENVTFPEINVNFGERIFLNCSNLKTVEISKTNAVTIPASMFSGCPSLENVILPKSITVIKGNAFYGCRSLVSVGLKETQTAFIMESAFDDCSKYSDGEFPNSIQVIENKAFLRCNIDKLFLPLSTLKKVGDYAFRSNPLREGVDLRPFTTCDTIGDGIFTDCSIQSVRLYPFKGKNVTCRWMFESCHYLEEVQMEEGAQLYRGIFSGCENLKTVILPETITTIPMSAFTKCKSLEDIRFPESITKINDCAFMSTVLEKADLSKSKLLEIDYKAFIHTNIKDVKLPAYDCTICNNSFNEDVMNNIFEEYPFVAVKEITE